MQEKSLISEHKDQQAPKSLVIQTALSSFVELNHNDLDEPEDNEEQPEADWSEIDSITPGEFFNRHAQDSVYTGRRILSFHQAE